jgi:hypothetical protein
MVTYSEKASIIPRGSGCATIHPRPSNSRAESVQGAPQSGGRTRRRYARRPGQDQLARLWEATAAQPPEDHARESDCSSHTGSRAPAARVQAVSDASGSQQGLRQQHQARAGHPPPSGSLHGSAPKHHGCDGPDHLVRAANVTPAAPSAAYAALLHRISMTSSSLSTAELSVELLKQVNDR